LHGKSRLHPQHEEIIGRTEARMLEYPQRTPSARMLEARLQSEHLPEAKRETPRDQHVRLSLAHGAIAGVQDRRDVMPTLGRRRLNQVRNRSVQEERKEKARCDCFAVTHAKIRIRKPTHEKLLRGCATIGLKVRIHRWQ
jgi:hypothetical protein